MYENDYSVSLPGIALWLLVAAFVSCGLAFIRRPVLRKRLLLACYWFPAWAATAFCAALGIVLPDDRYMSSPVGWHWLILLCVAILLSLLLTPIRALTVRVSLRLAGRFRQSSGAAASGG
jgi:hypothetical protein